MCHNFCNHVLLSKKSECILLYSFRGGQIVFVEKNITEMRNCHANFKLFTQFLSIFSLVGSFTFFIIGLAFAWAVGGHGLRTCKGFQTWCGDNKWRKLAMYSRVIRKKQSSLEPSFWPGASWSWAFGLELDPNFWAGAGTELLGWS